MITDNFFNRMLIFLLQKGLIRTAEGNYFIKPVDASADPRHPREHIISREAKGGSVVRNQGGPPQCGSPGRLILYPKEEFFHSQIKNSIDFFLLTPYSKS